MAKSIESREPENESPEEEPKAHSVDEVIGQAMEGLSDDEIGDRADFFDGEWTKITRTIEGYQGKIPAADVKKFNALQDFRLIVNEIQSRYQDEYEKRTGKKHISPKTEKVEK